MKLSSVVFVLLSSIAFSVFAKSDDQSIYGVWETNKTEWGYLLVETTLCEEKLCGIVRKAFHQNGVEAENYVYLGQKLFWDMKEMPKKGDDFFGTGTIMSPVSGKRFKGAVKLFDSGNILKVSGMLGPHVRTFSWKRVSGDRITEKTSTLECLKQVKKRRVFGTREDAQILPEFVCKGSQRGCLFNCLKLLI